jgi:hypothetical protein
MRNSYYRFSHLYQTNVRFVIFSAFTAAATKFTKVDVGLPTVLFCILDGMHTNENG